MLRLVCDENYDGDILRGLRRQLPALDLVRVQEVGLTTTPDPAILAWAAAEGRILASPSGMTSR